MRAAFWAAAHDAYPPRGCTRHCYAIEEENITMADTATETYSTIRFFLRHGDKLAWLIGLAIAAYGIWGAFNGGSWVCAAIGLIAGWFGFMLMRCFRELLALVADTLMPQ